MMEATRRAGLLPLGGALLFACLVGMGFWGLARWFQAQLLAEARRSVLTQVMPLRAGFANALERRFFHLEGLAGFVDIHGAEDSSYPEFHFLSYAERVFARVEGVRTVALAPEGVIRLVFPLEGNEEALGLDLLAGWDETRQDEGVRRALEERRLSVTGPVELRQGGRGIIGLLPIYIAGRFWGFASMVVTLPALLSEVGFGVLWEEFSLALRNPNGDVFFGIPEVFEADPVRQTISYGGNVWELGAVPRGGWNGAIRERLRYFLLGEGLLLLVLTLFVHAALWRYVSLSGEVAYRTEELTRANRELQAEAEERRRVHAALRERERRFRTIVENSEAGYVFCDTNRIVRNVNRAWLSLHGFAAPEDVLGTDFLHHVPAEQIRETAALLERLFQGERAVSGESARLRRDGSLGYHTYSLTVVVENGRVVGAEGFFLDTTERRKAFEELRILNAELEERVAARTKELVEANRTLEEKNARLAELNEELSAMNEEVGASNEQLSAMNEELTAMNEELAANNETLLLERERRAELERRLREMEEELDGFRRKAERLALVSHEFRTPLSSILTSVQLLEDFWATMDEERRRGHLHRIEENVRHLSALAREGLFLGCTGNGREGRICTEGGFGERVSMEVLPFCRRLVEEFAAGEGRNAVLRCVAGEGVTDAEPLVASLDPVGFRILLTNLLSNAVKYSPPGSVVEVVVGRRDDCLELTVADEGMGISAEDLPRLFDPFFRGESARHVSGTGLGLHMVKRLVDDAGGSLSVTSVPGKGTTVTILLPLEEAGA
ncbi:ATP-binding protein [Aminiphilus circumscriptus]|uniref:sensor histidine kinase n=1 Tax=Aminiphilus circumscriptus TaxID=290732 RepID=UPI00047858CD|nr:ATP-binding protein [Aminiphilus circumscriptus]